MGIIMDKIDIHSHILYGIDDGSKSIEDSIKILKQQENLGFTDIILTPHYIENSKYKANNKDKEKLLNVLKNELKKQNININLYLGNEVYINNNIMNLLCDNEIKTLNGSNYLLIELPLCSSCENAVDIVYELKINGITPIIAHPERYKFIQDDISKIDVFIDEGALFQANYGSILGIYGNKAKKTVKKLLKNDSISFLGTDIHYPNSKIYSEMDNIVKKISKIIGTDKLKELAYTNAIKILNNEEF
ncbi:MAG: hypothetical protein J6D28_03895 [Bacilli bacterium]|nr:hypothetical protein [Bacilli bacterium]